MLKKIIILTTCFSLIFPINANAMSSVFSGYNSEGTNKTSYNQNISSINSSVYKFNEVFNEEKIEEIKIEGIKKLAVNYTDEITYIYEEANVKSKKIAILPPNGVCDIIEDENITSLDSFLNEQDMDIFVYVKSGEFEGYIKSEDITTKNLNKYLTVSTYAELLDNTECKKEPKNNSETIYTIPSETIIEVLSYSDDNQWVCTEYHGENYYVKSSKLNIKTLVDYAYEYERSSNYKKADLTYKTESEFHDSIVEFALQFVGNKYVWGGTSLTNGTDCSGFTQSVYRQFGYNLDRTAHSQYNDGINITEDELLPGDLVFYGNKYHITHVAIYIGDGQIVHASNRKAYPAGGIKISNYDYQTPYGYTRIVEF